MNLNRRQWLGFAGMGGLGIASCLSGCHAAPLTGRRQLMLMTENQEIALGVKAFDKVVAEQPSSQNVPLSQLVARVGQRIASVSDRADLDWDFRLIASPDQNAFCLPGGKVAVYEGMLSVCENEAGLAVVMSHEVAHALARHGGERMSQNAVNDTAKGVVNRISRKNVPERADLLLNAYGVASQYGVLLPYSRQQESEADEIGVMLMAQAGYDPNEATRFWNRFGGESKESLPEFMSTHPSDQRRSADLMALMGEASRYYSAAEQKYGRGKMIVPPEPLS